ncbi:MAG TPA: Ig-like domain-containing protein [Nonomuraea sp.]|nr:Ig-like domain-containing protein [Nonomuraea sp.]
MLSSTFVPRRLPRIAALMLVGATATCVEHPTDPRDAEITPGPVATAATATTIAHKLLTSGNSPVDQRVCTTASISPAANALVTVAVMGHNTTAAAPSPTVSGGGMTAWTQVATVAFDGVTTPHKRLSIFRALRASPGSGPIKITFTTQQANCQWIVSQWQGVVTSGTNGSGAIVRARTALGDNVTGRVVTLPAFASPGNVAYGIFGVRRSTIGVTPGAGFTEIVERASGETPLSDLQAEWSVNDNTIDAAWPRVNGGGLGLEIRATAPAVVPGVPVGSVGITPDSAGVAVGRTVQLTAATVDAGGEPLVGRAVTWSTDNAQVATVSGTGLVTGVAVGTATLTATSEGKNGTARVTVTAAPAPVASLEVTPALPTLAEGSRVQLTITAKDSAGQPLTGRTATWATSDPQVATVSGTGLVTGVAAGLAVITATSEGQPGTSSVTVTALPPSAFSGEWSPVLPSPVIQVHSHLLRDGKVLSWGLQGAPQLWDPATGNFTAVPSPSLLFCTGHAFLADGRLLVAGGHLSNGHGLPNTNIFDATTGSWQTAAPMAQGRWYPTTTTLPNGEVLVLTGQDTAGKVTLVPEIWNGTAWRRLTTASLSLPNYPRTFVAPNGKVFYAGAAQQSRWLDVTGTGTWSLGPSMNFGTRTYGSAVMYEPGKILFVGGGGTPTNSAEIIDLNSSNPQWTYTGSMAYARWNTNATLLPTGDVLVTGGTSNADRTIPGGAVNVAELWSPGSGQWTQLAAAAPLLRGYHSTSVLLPDGRVLHGGGGDGGGVPDNFNYEVYSPPYLFKGARPVISGTTPDVVGYGQTVAVPTPDGPNIAKVTLIRLGSVTHAFDQAQRLVPLNFSQSSGGLSVTLPASRTAAPPGPYLLFLVSADGVPSVGQIMRLQ